MATPSLAESVAVPTRVKLRINSTNLLKAHSVSGHGDLEAGLSRPYLLGRHLRRHWTASERGQQPTDCSHTYGQCGNIHRSRRQENCGERQHREHSIRDRDELTFGRFTYRCIRGCKYIPMLFSFCPDR
jgi:hypothetical protein